MAGNCLAKEADTDPTATAFSDFAAGAFPADSEFDESTVYAYDANDRLLSEELDTTGDGAPDRTTTYEYSAPATPGVNDWTVQTRKTVTGDVNETHAYEFNNQRRLSRTEVTKGATTITTYAYDDDGVRVRREEIDPADGTTVLSAVEYLIDAQNPTGYAKPAEEWVDGTLARTYALGHMIISQADAAGAPRFFLHDGHGSTRALLDGLTVLERYAYDAFGEAIGFDPATAATTWLFAGDGQYDPASDLVNHIRRWRQGPRFLSRDPITGDMQDPISLHKYLYAHADPVNGIDPSGLFTVVGLSAASSIGTTLNILDAQTGQFAASAFGFNLYTDPIDLLFAREVGIFPDWVYDAGASIIRAGLDLIQENAPTLGFAASAILVGVVGGGRASRGLLGHLNDYNDVLLREAAQQGATSRTIHNLYVNTVRPGAREVVFNVPGATAGRLGTRRFDDFDDLAGIAFEGNTTPWSAMSLDQLQRKLDQVGSDLLLLRQDPQVRRIVWFGTEPLPKSGLAGQLREALDQAGIEYWVVVP